jgi:hypothetical protein
LRVLRGDLPQDALVLRYRDQGSYIDCYTIDVAKAVSLAAYVEAFYTSPLFRVERFLITWLVSRPATDSDVRALARAEVTKFSAWDTEDRRTDQLLMRDYQGRTRSWFMVTAIGPAQTRLIFGSAVVAETNRRTGAKQMPLLFRALLWFHKLYSRLLLRSAANNL